MLIRGNGSDEQFAAFDHAERLHTWGRKAAYRVVGIGHSADTTVLDLLSDRVPSTPAAGAHLAELLHTAHDTQQSRAVTRNDELRVQLRQAHMQHVGQKTIDVTLHSSSASAYDRNPPPDPDGRPHWRCSLSFCLAPSRSGSCAFSGGRTPRETGPWTGITN